jgi:hypothetical protein
MVEKIRQELTSEYEETVIRLALNNNDVAVYRMEYKKGRSEQKPRDGERQKPVVHWNPLFPRPEGMVVQRQRPCTPTQQQFTRL